MGNTAAFEKLPSAFQNLNEDNMVVLLQYLDVSDFVHLTQTSRKLLNETLGPNNYLWAQLLNRPVPSPLQPSFPMVGPFPVPPSLKTHFANHVLNTTRDGRKFAVDGVPLNLSVPFDTVNKHLVSHFDFKKEIKSYYLIAKCAQTLRQQLMPLTHSTNASSFPNIRVEYGINPADYDTRSDVLTDKAVPDVTFVVELAVDATSLENLQQKKLPGMHRSRRVVYAKSPVHANWAYVFSRSRMMPPNPFPQPQPMPQQLYNPLQQPFSTMPPPGPYLGQPNQLPQPGLYPQQLSYGNMPLQPPQPIVTPQPPRPKVPIRGPQPIIGGSRPPIPQQQHQQVPIPQQQSSK
jgi:hypothetical protein